MVKPLPPTAPPPPPRPLPPGTTGAAESAHLHRVRVQLAQLIPTIEGLHADAAIEIRRADFEAAPAMAALVERLSVLYRVQIDMTGTVAATTAAASAEEVRQRLALGVRMYEELLNGAANVVGSGPDPGPVAAVGHDGARAGRVLRGPASSGGNRRPRPAGG